MGPVLLPPTQVPLPLGPGASQVVEVLIHATACCCVLVCSANHISFELTEYSITFVKSLVQREHFLMTFCSSLKNQWNVMLQLVRAGSRDFLSCLNTHKAEVGIMLDSLVVHFF